MPDFPPASPNTHPADSPATLTDLDTVLAYVDRGTSWRRKSTPRVKAQPEKSFVLIEQVIAGLLAPGEKRARLVVAASGRFAETTTMQARGTTQ